MRILHKNEGMGAWCAQWIAVLLVLAATSTNARAANHRDAPIINNLIVGAGPSESAQGLIMNHCGQMAELLIIITPRIVQEEPAPEEQPVEIPMLLAAGEARTFDIPLGIPFVTRLYATVEVRAWPGECTAPGLNRIELAAVVLNQAGGTSAIIRSRGFGFVEQAPPAEIALTLDPVLVTTYHLGSGEAAEVAVANFCEVEWRFVLLPMLEGPGSQTYVLPPGGFLLIPVANGGPGWHHSFIQGTSFSSPLGACLAKDVASTVNTFSIGDGGTVEIALLLPAVQKVPHD